MTELKPCPLCGGEAELIVYDNEHIGYPKTEIKCKSCPTKQLILWKKHKFDRESAVRKSVEKWNRMVSK